MTFLVTFLVCYSAVITFSFWRLSVFLRKIENHPYDHHVFGFWIFKRECGMSQEESDAYVEELRENHRRMMEMTDWFDPKTLD